MLYYLTAVALIAHTFFWGLGLAWLTLPRGWRRWWWVFAPGFGLALQSAVVWAGAHTPLAGTNAYAFASELLPLSLIMVAVWRRGWPVARAWLVNAQMAGGLLLAAVVAGWVLLWPMAQRGGWTLTASSLGSCDHADYAAGARVLQEFSKDDRTGFLGQTEVTQVGSAETFFEFWLRLNHFTPSALLAHNGAVFGLQCHQLVSVTAVALVLLNASLVLLLARVAVGLRGVAGLVPAVLYLFSPLGAYAVHQGALGQLYAAHGIAVLTLAVMGAGRAQRRGRSVWPWAALVLAAFWILAGSYNFILTVALAPAGAWLLAECWQRREWRGSARVVGMFGVMFLVCVGLFWGRFDGVVERFRLFGQYDFGWPVPILTPEGWLGLLRDTGLNGWPLWWRVGLAGLVAGPWLAGVILLWGRRREHAWGALALVVPVVAGWLLIVWEAQTRANASYDAFKLLSVFHPGLLAALMGWLGLIRRDCAVWRRAAGLGLVLLVLAANGRESWLFAQQMATPPLRVERGLLDLRRLERMPRVTSLNMRISKFWSRLWANALLLRVPQYFSIHTYEGRLNTALKGEWDLSDSLLRSQPLRDADFVDLNPQFHVVRVDAPGRVDLAYGEGWYDREGKGFSRWRWNSGLATIRVTNPAARPLRTTLVMRVRLLEAGSVEVELNAKAIGGSGSLSRDKVHEVEFGEVLLPPGESILHLKTSNPPGHAGPDDPRLLAIALYSLTVKAER